MQCIVYFNSAAEIEEKSLAVNILKCSQ